MGRDVLPEPWHARGSTLYDRPGPSGRVVAYRVVDGFMVQGIRSAEELAVVAVWAKGWCPNEQASHGRDNVIPFVATFGQVDAAWMSL